jgi:hypothetical protein
MTNPQPKFACAIPIQTTKFLWIIAGPQTEHAANEKTFNEVTQTEKEKQ